MMLCVVFPCVFYIVLS